MSNLENVVTVLNVYQILADITEKELNRLCF